MKSQDLAVIPDPSIILKSAICCNCKKRFFERSNQESRGKNPLLLHCGHSICVTCCRNVRTGVVLCGVCNSSTELQSVSQPTIFLPKNAYLMGRVSLANKLNQLHSISYKAASPRLKKLSVKGLDVRDFLPKSGSCYECSLADATMACLQCDCNFCGTCWTKVHSSGKSLQEHIPAMVTNSLNWRKIEHCKIHEMKVLEFYCRNCNEYVCANCMLLDHQGEYHKLITLEDRNLELFEEVDQLKEEVNINMLRMMESIKEVKALRGEVYSQNTAYRNVENEVVQHFIHLHGVLQMAEYSILKKLEEAGSARKNRLEEILQQLDIQIETSQIVLKEVNSMMKNVKNVRGEVFMPRIVEILTDLKKLPSQFVVNDDEDVINEEEIVSFDDTLIERIRNFCTLTIPPNKTYDLQSDLVEDVLFFSAISDAKDLEKEAERDQDLMSFKSRNSSCSDVFHKALNFEEGSRHIVDVIHVKSPAEFYVTPVTMRKQQKKISVASFLLAAKSQNLPECVLKGEYYLAQPVNEKNWYRGKVIDVLPERDESHEIVAVLHFIDYGNIAEIPLSRLRKMSSVLLREPPMAVLCKLFECFPRDGDWSKAATKSMRDIVNKSIVTMHVMKVHPDVLEVDLSTSPKEENCNKEVSSLRDSMICLEYATIVDGAPSYNVKVESGYLTQIQPKVDEEFPGIICSVLSHSHFYVQKIGHESPYMINIMEKLKVTYDKNNSEDLIYSPVRGMPCAALYSQDENWYRGTIIDVPGGESVTVYYVDYGNEETIPWNYVRILHPEFLKIAPQALKCALKKMAEPKSARKWKRDAVTYLEESFTGVLRVKVTGKKEGFLKVILYTDDGLCVNTELMEPLRDHPRIENFSPKKARTKYVEESSEGFCPLPEELSEEYEEEYEETLQEEENKIETDEESTSSEIKEEDVKIEVRILHAKTPSDIYLSFFSETEELEKEMENYCTKWKVENAFKWKPNMKCAAMNSTINQWLRGTVSDILENGKLRVFFNDVDLIEDLPDSKVRILDEGLSSFLAPVLKCHLYGVFPPEKEWPGVCCDFLKREIRKCHSIYITKMNDIENDSLAIKLYGKKKIPGGALEPGKEEWVLLNDLILSEGLAVSEEAKRFCPVTITEGGRETWERGSNDNVKVPAVMENLTSQVVYDWIQPKKAPKDRFIGVPTFVDSNGVIYMHDFGEDGPQLEMMSDLLCETYLNSKRYVNDEVWIEGDICVVEHYLDGSWYRGKILEVNDDLTYDVFFVDYGYVETCNATEVQRAVKCFEIPPLARKYKLHGIIPANGSEEFHRYTMYILHTLIVDKKCDVTVINKSSDPFIPSTIKLKLCDEKMDVAQHLVLTGHAKFGPELDARVEEFMKNWKKCPGHVSEPDGKKRTLSYSPLEIPPHLKRLPIEVLIVKFSEFSAHVSGHESIPEELRTVISDFVRLTEEIQSVAERQEPFLELTEGMPCISQYSENGKWYRAEILTFDADKNLVLVRYVDYGNEEYVPKERVRKCRDDWFGVPKMALTLRLSHVRIGKEVKLTDYLLALTGCLTKADLTAEIVERKKNAYEVEVWAQGGELAYSEMIDHGLMERI